MGLTAGLMFPPLQRGLGDSQIMGDVGDPASFIDDQSDSAFTELR
nr:hypothetical protein [Nocardia sp. MH4]